MQEAPPTSGEAEGARGGESSSDKGTSTDAAAATAGVSAGATSSRGGGRQVADSARMMRAALRALRLRLDKVGRRMSELDFDNRALMGRVSFFRSENSKLHQALEKERAKLRTLLDRGAGAPYRPPTDAASAAAATLGGGSSAASVPSAPSSATIEQGPWPLVPSIPGPSRLLADMTPSTSSASLDTILAVRRVPPRKQLEAPPPPLPPPTPQPLLPSPQLQQTVVALASTAASTPLPPLQPPVMPAIPLSYFGQGHRSTASFQNGSEDPLFLFTDLFGDSSDESVNRNLAFSRQVPSTDTVPSTSTAPRLLSSNTTVASEVATTKDHSQDQEQPQEQPPEQPLEQPQSQPAPEPEPQPGSSTPPNPSDRKRIKLKAAAAQDEYKPPEISDVYEPKYSMSSSSLD